MAQYSISSSVSKIGSSFRNTKRNRYKNNKSSSSLSSSSSSHDYQNDGDCSLVEQYKKWCAELKIELKSKSKVNVDVRLQRMENIVNDVTNSELDTERTSNFNISDDDKQEMMKQIEDKIDSWRGVEIEVCRNKEKKNFEAYQATARNWFNRNKAKIYGNHLFYTIIYDHILKFCAEIDGITEEKKMILFIDIFDRILNEPVQFPRTKLQPLLPHQSLMQPNRFKKASEQFTMIYNTRWMLANNSANNSKRDRDRAKKIHTSFTNCLAQIKQQLQTSPCSCPPMPYPFESIMNDTSTPTTKSITSSNKSISIDYEINQVVANRSPLKYQRRSSSSNGDLKLSMVDHPSSASTQSTQSKDDSDDIHIDDSNMNDFPQTRYDDGYDAQFLDDEYMNSLPPTVEMGGFHRNPSIRQYPVGTNNNINKFSDAINHNIHGIVTGNHLINDVIDEVVYEPNFKIEEMNGYYDDTPTMYQSSEYPQLTRFVNTNNNNNNHHHNNNNHLNAFNPNFQNFPNSNINNNINQSNMLCVGGAVPSIPSMQHNPNIAPIQIQQPFVPQYFNTANLVTLPTLNRPFPANNQQQFDHINDTQRSIQNIPRSTNSAFCINHQNQGNMLPETSLNGQISSSSVHSSDGRSLNSSLSGSYAPSRGINSNLTVSTKRYSPISSPTNNQQSTTPIMANHQSNTTTNSSSSISMNYNDHIMVNNPRMIDSYQITPFSPSFDNNQNHNNNHINNDNNDNFVFTNLSNISSPTPLLGGFL